MEVIWWEQYAWYLTLVLGVVLVLRICRERLFLAYRAFALYMAWDTLESVLGLVFQSHRNQLTVVYMAMQAVKVLLGVLVVLDLYFQSFQGRKALAAFGRNVLAVLFLLVALGTGFGLLIEPSMQRDESPLLRRFLAIEKSIDFLSLLLLVLIALALVWFPIQVRRNTIIFFSGFVVYFSARWVGLLLTNHWPERTHELSAAMLSAAGLCMFGWIFALRREESDSTTVIGHAWDPDEMDRLTSQLDAANKAISRFRKF